MTSNVRSLVFAAILCVACSVLLTAASIGLKARQEKNMAVDRQTNILKALRLIHEDENIGAQQIQNLFRTKIRHVWVSRKGEIISEPQNRPDALPLYVYVEQADIKAYVVPIDTRGLWGPIHGYLAMDNDGATVRGFTVYQHQETPGLGGEIESRWFRKNFEGKKIVNPRGDFVSVHIAKGHVKDMVPPGQRINYVDGISGATMTGKFLSAGMRDILKSYEPMAIQLRHNKKRYLRTL